VKLSQILKNIDPTVSRDGSVNFPAQNFFKYIEDTKQKNELIEYVAQRYVE
jgi:hypothetical protein